MQIQPVSSTNQNNSFKARFINDKNGYFRELWRTAPKTYSLDHIIDEFCSKYKDHAVEIIDVACVGQYDPVNKIYTLFNHKTGNICRVSNDNSTINGFYNLLKNLLKVDGFFNESSDLAKMYKKITGQG